MLLQRHFLLAFADFVHRSLLCCCCLAFLFLPFKASQKSAAEVGATGAAVGESVGYWHPLFPCHWQCAKFPFPHLFFFFPQHLAVGEAVGTVGVPVGMAVGPAVGLRVGFRVGLAVGADVGLAEGPAVGLAEGLSEGAAVGLDVGLDVGVPVGPCVGLRVGYLVGFFVGNAVGFFVGSSEGDIVGASVTISHSPS